MLYPPSGTYEIAGGEKAFKLYDFGHFRGCVTMNAGFLSARSSPFFYCENCFARCGKKSHVSGRS